MEWSYSLYENMRLCRSNHVLSSFYDILTGKVGDPQPSTTPLPRYPQSDRQGKQSSFTYHSSPWELHLLMRIQVNTDTREENPVHARHCRLLLLTTELLEDLISFKHFRNIVSALSDKRLLFASRTIHASFRKPFLNELMICPHAGFVRSGHKPQHCVGPGRLVPQHHIRAAEL